MARTELGEPNGQQNKESPAGVREGSMIIYQPSTVSELAGVIDHICAGLLDDLGRPISEEMKQALAKRVIELFENGVTDPDRLTIEVMADRLWASARAENENPTEAKLGS